MKAISLWQPWASFLVCGIKRYETRGWPTEHRGPLLVHAAASEPAAWKQLWVSPGYVELLARLFALQGCVRNGDGWEGLPRGKILGVVHLRACVTTTEAANGEVLTADELRLGDWSAGRWAWRCEDPVPFKRPIAARGRQRLWTYDGALAEWGA